MIKNVIFDFGGVLVDWNPRRVYGRYFSTSGEMEYFLAHVCSQDWNTEQDRGRTYAEGARLLKAEFPEYAEAIDLYYTRWDEMLGGPVESTVELLKKLKGKGFRCYGLSNWSAETFPLARDRYEFFQWLDGMVISGYEKLAKPDPAIFELLLARYQLRAEECAFLDDVMSNVEAARALGFHAIHFTGAEEAEKVLNRML